MIATDQQQMERGQIICSGLTKELLPKSDTQRDGEFQAQKRAASEMLFFFFLSGELLPIMINEHAQRK